MHSHRSQWEEGQVTWSHMLQKGRVLAEVGGSAYKRSLAASG